MGTHPIFESDFDCLTEMSLYQEVRLFSSVRQREEVENKAELYSIIKTLQELEKAYIKDAVPSDVYTTQCSKLLVQYKNVLPVADITSVEDFVEKYRLDCRLAMARIKEDRPITQRDNKGNFNALIGEIVALFITIQDNLHLQSKAKDQLFPDICELVVSMDRMTALPETIKEPAKLWESTLKPMNASDEITEEEARQMLFDIESSYGAFNQFLKST